MDNFDTEGIYDSILSGVVPDDYWDLTISSISPAVKKTVNPVVRNHLIVNTDLIDEYSKGFHLEAVKRLSRWISLAKVGVSGDGLIKLDKDIAALMFKGFGLGSDQGPLVSEGKFDCHGPGAIIREINRYTLLCTERYATHTSDRLVGLYAVKLERALMMVNQMVEVVKRAINDNRENLVATLLTPGDEPCIADTYTLSEARQISNQASLWATLCQFDPTDIDATTQAMLDLSSRAKVLSLKSI